MNTDTTFVTAFYDISRNTSKEMNKFDNYFIWIKTLLSQNIQIIFYTSQNIFERIGIEKDNIKFIITENIPYQKTVNWKDYRSNDLEKDSEKFAQLTYSKFLWVKKAIELNHFNTEYFCWIDAGICKVAQNINMVNSIKIKNKINLMLLNYISEFEMKNPSDFIKECRYKVAGGFFGGNASNMLNFIQLFFEQLDKYPNNGLEQEYMAIIYYQNRDLFFPYWGDFSDLFINYERCMNNRQIVEKYIKNCVDHRDFEEYKKVTNYFKL